MTTFNVDQLYNVGQDGNPGKKKNYEYVFFDEIFYYYEVDEEGKSIEPRSKHLIYGTTEFTYFGYFDRVKYPKYFKKKYGVNKKTDNDNYIEKYEKLLENYKDKQKNSFFSTQLKEKNPIRNGGDVPIKKMKKTQINNKNQKLINIGQVLNDNTYKSSFKILNNTVIPLFRTIKIPENKNDKNDINDRNDTNNRNDNNDRNNANDKPVYKTLSDKNRPDFFNLPKSEIIIGDQELRKESTFGVFAKRRKR